MEMLLYDADCAFCTRSARIGMRFGLRAQIMPMQSVDLVGLGIDIDRAQREIPSVGARGAVSYGALAIADALSTGNALCRTVSTLMRSWPIRQVANGVYRLVARNRHHLPGGTPACAITSPTNTLSGGA